jgi:hypothetical protein
LSGASSITGIGIIALSWANGQWVPDGFPLIHV